MYTCDICDHLKNESNAVLATQYWVVALTPDQGYVGRCYVTLREHKASLANLSDQEWADYARIVRTLEHAAYKAFNATPANWACMMNNAYQEESAQPHVHWHFRPRYRQPVEINGVTFDDPLYGYHYDRDQRKKVDADTFQAILERLRAALDTKV